MAPRERNERSGAAPRELRRALGAAPGAHGSCPEARYGLRGGPWAAQGSPQRAQQRHEASWQWQTSGEHSGKPQWQTYVFEVLQWQTDF